MQTGAVAQIPASSSSAAPAAAAGPGAKKGHFQHALSKAKGKAAAKKAPTTSVEAKRDAGSASKTAAALLAVPMNVPAKPAGTSPKSAGDKGGPLAARAVRLVSRKAGPMPASPKGQPRAGNAETGLAIGKTRGPAAVASNASAKAGAKANPAKDVRTKEAPSKSGRLVATLSQGTLPAAKSLKPAARGVTASPAASTNKAGKSASSSRSPGFAAYSAARPPSHAAPVQTAASPGTKSGTPPVQTVTATQIGPSWRVQGLTQSGNGVRFQVKPPDSAPLKVEMTVSAQQNATHVALTVPTPAWQHPLAQDSHLLQARLQSQNLPNPQVTVNLNLGAGAGSGQGSAGYSLRGSPTWMPASPGLPGQAAAPASTSGLDFRA